MTGHKPDLPKAIDEHHIFSEQDLLPAKKRGTWKVMLPILLGLVLFIWLGNHFGLDKKVTTAGAALLGVGSGVLAWLVGIISMVPIIGPLVIKILSIGFIWLLNAIGYFVSFVAIRRGYSQDVLTYRGLTIALLTGIVIGYIIAQYI